MRINRLTGILTVILLAGCGSTPPGVGPLGPTGNAADTKKLTPVQVRATWKYDLLPRTQNVVKKRVRFPLHVLFDDKVRYEAYYDDSKDVTWVAVYGNVTSISDYGTEDHNGYYVTWTQPGRLHEDFPPPWRLDDVELLDQPY